MSKKIRFYLEWMLFNPIGFTLGSLHGATDNGLVPSVIPGYAGLVLGDLVFGAMVGFVQYIVFRRTGYLPAAKKWIIASSIGFTLGARIGALLTFRLTSDWQTAGIIFGIFMGGSIGLVTALTLYKQFPLERLLIWIVSSVAAWVLGEWVAFASFFSLKAVPLVALAVAAITGLGLISLRPNSQTEIPGQTSQR